MFNAQEDNKKMKMQRLRKGESHGVMKKKFKKKLFWEGHLRFEGHHLGGRIRYILKVIPGRRSNGCLMNRYQLVHCPLINKTNQSFVAEQVLMKKV